MDEQTGIVTMEADKEFYNMKGSFSPGDEYPLHHGFVVDHMLNGLGHPKDADENAKFEKQCKEKVAEQKAREKKAAERARVPPEITRAAAPEPAKKPGKAADVAKQAMEGK